MINWNLSIDKDRSNPTAKLVHFWQSENGKLLNANFINSRMIQIMSNVSCRTASNRTKYSFQAVRVDMKSQNFSLRGLLGIRRQDNLVDYWFLSTESVGFSPSQVDHLYQQSRIGYIWKLITCWSKGYWMYTHSFSNKRIHWLSKSKASRDSRGKPINQSCR